MVERLLRDTLRGVRLNHHAVQFGETVEVRGVRAAVIARQCVQYLRRRNSGTLALRGVDVHPVLRVVVCERRVCRFYFGTLVQSLHEPVAYILELGQVAAGLVLQVEFEASAHAVPRNHRRRHHEHVGIRHVGGDTVKPSRQLRRRLSLSFTLVPVGQFDNIHAHRRTGTVE